MAKVTGGELLVRALRARGVRQVFSLPGAGIFPIYDACLTEGIAVTAGRHEGAVVHAAEGWARLSGEPGIAILPEGPGHANGVAGVATAYAECSPVIMMSAIDESSCLGKGAIQELPQVAMCAPITKWATLVSDIAQVPDCVTQAFIKAQTGVPGPVHLSLTADVLEQVVEETDVLLLEAPPAQADTAADPDGIEQAVDLLAGAERPVIIAGITAYWSKAGPHLQGLIEQAHIPLFTVERARGLVSDDHPYCFGDGYSSVNPVAQLIHHADVVAVLGDKIDCRFAYGRCFGQAKVIHVCPEPREIGKNCPVAVGPSCDAGTAAAQLLAAAGHRDWKEKRKWLEALREARQEHEALFRDLAASDHAPPHPLRIAKEVERFIDEDTVLVFDGGDVSGWTRSYFRARRPGRWQTGTVLGHMGIGLPYAIGAQLAAPESRVVLLTGDGALGFCAAEFETAVRHRLPVVVVVANDACWGIEEYLQTESFGPDRRVATGLTNVRWDQVAVAMGGHGEHVETPDQLRPALDRAFAAGRPACVNVTVEGTPSPMAQSFSRVFKRRRARIRQTRES